MFKIRKVTFENFKIFRSFEIEINESINIFVGDNGTGKSSILQGIELALSGSTTKVQNIGLENIINVSAVRECLESCDIKILPKTIIEVYLSTEKDIPINAKFFGEKNKKKTESYGIRLICEPDEEYINDIQSSLNGKNQIFPYDLYKIRFLTFCDERFNSYRKPLKTCYIDSSEIDSKYVLRNTVREAYLSSVTEEERVLNMQRFKELIGRFQFEGRAGDEGIYVSSNLEENLNIERSGVPLANLGKGDINLIKTSYAFKQANEDVSIILLEEPENHLTHWRMRKLLQKITEKSIHRQIFIATHSSQIASRLGLNNVFFIGRQQSSPVSLRNLPNDTSNFFKKAVSDNLLQFILSSRVILVEGAAEYILMGKFYENITKNTPEKDGVWIISVNGLSFQRYLQVASLIRNRVAVITDNDKSKQPKYSELCTENINVFMDSDTERYTLEKCIYDDNKELCRAILKKDEPLSWMLKHKSEAAYKLLLSAETIDFKIPSYIKNAIEWIRK